MVGLLKLILSPHHSSHLSRRASGAGEGWGRSDQVGLLRLFDFLLAARIGEIKQDAERERRILERQHVYEVVTFREMIAEAYTDIKVQQDRIEEQLRANKAQLGIIEQKLKAVVRSAGGDLSDMPTPPAETDPSATVDLRAVMENRKSHLEKMWMYKTKVLANLKERDAQGLLSPGYGQVQIEELEDQIEKLEAELEGYGRFP